MTRSHAVLRSFRKPVLALLAAAGLVVGSGAGTLAAPGSAPVPRGESALASAEFARSAALTPAGISVPAGITSAGERQQPRLDGATGSAWQPRRARGSAAGTARTGATRAADPAAIIFLVLSMSGRDSAPSTAPPSVPS